MSNFFKLIANYKHWKQVKIKKLKWWDNITDKGKESGLFEIISDITELNLSYHIRNYKLGGEPVTDKYYVFLKDDDMIECSYLKEAKLVAQTHFEQTVFIN